MLQDTLAIREEQIKGGVGAEEARESLGIDVLVIEKENAIDIPTLVAHPMVAVVVTPLVANQRNTRRKHKSKG
ncbi:hypothetical protein JCM19236_5749 [Vibrio sp. JCM 19236]|nr:hypothetical protein JCM19236_5749 [Vibrio sp. JCM 19236]